MFQMPASCARYENSPLDSESDTVTCEPCISWSHGLPCFVHGLNVFLGFHPQRGNTRASLIHVLHWVFIRVSCRALVWRGGHRLHPLAHGLIGVQETMACISLLKALWRAHEPWDAVYRRGAGQRGCKPWIQGQRVGHWSHVGVHRWPIEGQHRRVVELHTARVHFLLAPPFGSAILEPHLWRKTATTFSISVQFTTFFLNRFLNRKAKTWILIWFRNKSN